MRILSVLSLALALLFVGAGVSSAASGDRIQGDGTGWNGILTTNRCAEAVATRNGQFGPYVKIEKTPRTGGTCDVRARLSYWQNGTKKYTSWTYGRDFSMSRGPDNAQTCHAWVSLKRNDGTWLTFKFYNQNGVASCRK